jgi:plastocyanin
MFVEHCAKQKCTLRQNLLVILTPPLLSAVLLSGCNAGSAGIDQAGRGSISSTQPTASTEMRMGGSSTMAASAAESSPHQVSIDNFAFSPAELTVPVGTKVTWVNRDDVPHTATSTSKPKAFDSRTLDTDQTFSYVFGTAGTYEYFCAVHPRMTGKIIVK